MLSSHVCALYMCSYIRIAEDVVVIVAINRCSSGEAVDTADAVVVGGSVAVNDVDIVSVADVVVGSFAFKCEGCCCC